MISLCPQALFNTFLDRIAWHFPFACIIKTAATGTITNIFKDLAERVQELEERISENNLMTSKW